MHSMCDLHCSTREATFNRLRTIAPQDVSQSAGYDQARPIYDTNGSRVPLDAWIVFAIVIYLAYVYASASASAVALDAVNGLHGPGVVKRRKTVFVQCGSISINGEHKIIYYVLEPTPPPTPQQHSPQHPSPQFTFTSSMQNTDTDLDTASTITRRGDCRSPQVPPTPQPCHEHTQSTPRRNTAADSPELDEAWRSPPGGIGLSKYTYMHAGGQWEGRSQRGKPGGGVRAGWVFPFRSASGGGSGSGGELHGVEVSSRSWKMRKEDGAASAAAATLKPQLTKAKDLDTGSLKTDTKNKSKSKSHSVSVLSSLLKGNSTKPSSSTSLSTTTQTEVYSLSFATPTSRSSSHGSSGASTISPWSSPGTLSPASPISPTSPTSPTPHTSTHPQPQALYTQESSESQAHPHPRQRQRSNSIPVPAPALAPVDISASAANSGGEPQTPCSPTGKDWICVDPSYDKPMLYARNGSVVRRPRPISLTLGNLSMHKHEQAHTRTSSETSAWSKVTEKTVQQGGGLGLTGGQKGLEERSEDIGSGTGKGAGPGRSHGLGVWKRVGRALA